MIDFTLSEEQRSIAEMVRELMLEQVAPRTQEIDELAEFPVWVAELFRGLDLFAVAVPEEYGGIDGSLITLCVVVEQIARVSPACSMIVGVQSLGSTPISLFGSVEQKKRWLPAFAAGEKMVAFGLTEPNAGSDVKAMSTRAVRVDGRLAAQWPQEFHQSREHRRPGGVFCEGESRRPGQDHRVRGGDRSTGLRGRQGRAQDGAAGIAHVLVRAGGRLGAAGEPAGRGGAWPGDTPGDSASVAHLLGVSVARARPGRTGSLRRLREGAGAVRPAARQDAGRPDDRGRYGGTDGSGALHGLRSGR